MARNLEAKITKQMRDLIEAKLKKQNITPEQAISDMDIFMQDFSESDKHLINQYAKYVKHLIDNNFETRNAWDKFLQKLEEHRLSSKLGRAVKKENVSDKQAFKQSLDDLKEYEKLAKILKAPNKKANNVEDITVADKDDNEVFNPFDEQAAAELADLEAVENDHDDWTINDEEFNDEVTIDANDLGTLERNIEFSDDASVEQLKEEFSKIKAGMQSEIDDLKAQNDALKFKLANYEIGKLDDYEIADESDDEDLTDKLLAQRVPEGQQTMDFSVDHTKDKIDELDQSSEEPIDDSDDMIKTSEQTAVFDESMFDEPTDETTDEPEENSKKQWVDDANEDTIAISDDIANALSDALEETIESEPVKHFAMDSIVSDKAGNEYHVAGSRKTSDNRTEYLVRDDDGATYTFNFQDLKQK